MKRLLIAFVAFASFSSFADSQVLCGSAAESTSYRAQRAAQTSLNRELRLAYFDGYTKTSAPTVASNSSGNTTTITLCVTVTK
jgi:hypothetical protein